MILACNPPCAANIVRRSGVLCVISEGSIPGVNIAKFDSHPSPTGEDQLVLFLASLVAEDLSPKTVDGSASL